MPLKVVLKSIISNLCDLDINLNYNYLCEKKIKIFNEIVVIVLGLDNEFSAKRNGAPL